jgi:predicted short-subunit dehydrogenase-like oxidoreductase (DUF2520 family)
MNRYLLVGRGRLSRHLDHYLGLESIPHERWDRSSEQPFESLLARAESVLVLISDDAIESFLARNAAGDRRTWIHCSGSLSTPLADSAHPLMLFGDELYDRATYRRIPFVTERGRQSFPELFPDLENPHIEIDPDLKGLYHTLCTVGGNFSTLLWMKVFEEAESRLGLERELFYPYVEQVTRNLMASQDPLTGPLARGDERTVAGHLAALAGDPYEEVYRAFVNAHRAECGARRS